MVVEGPITGEMFLAYIEQCLVPTLKRGDIVVIDHLKFEVGPFEVGEKSDGHYSAWFSGENYKVFDLDMMRTVLVLCRSCAGICRRLRPCS
jgi:hypothetical protein